MILELPWTFESSTKSFGTRKQQDLEDLCLDIVANPLGRENSSPWKTFMLKVSEGISRRKMMDVSAPTHSPCLLMQVCKQTMGA